MVSHSEQLAFSSSIRAELETDQNKFTVAGTLFGNDMPRLIRLGDYRLEAYLDGTLMIFTHNDVPGIIGHVGSILGSHKINIAQMAVGRADSQGTEAIGVLNLDSVPTEESIKDVLANGQIRTAKTIELPAAGELPSWLS